MKYPKTKLLVLLILACLLYPVWYFTHYFTAANVAPEKLIEFGMEEEFLCQYKWRPDLLNVDTIIELQDTTIVNSDLLNSDEILIKHNLLSYPYTPDTCIKILLEAGVDPNWRFQKQNEFGHLQNLSTLYGKSQKAVKLILDYIDLFIIVMKKEKVSLPMPLKLVLLNMLKK